MTLPPLYQHQVNDIAFIRDKPHVLNFSDCGTGKTRVAIEIIKARQHEGKTLVICPKSIMQPAWAEDLKKFAPELTYSLAFATGRSAAFDAEVDVVITNHDAVKWLELEIRDKKRSLAPFCQLIVDESTAYKNESQRSKAAIKLSKHFKYRILMTGTPYTNTICDVWRQAMICDGGERLGKSFFRFRSEMCVGITRPGGFTEWVDKPHTESIVYMLLKDIVIRHKLEECTDIPEREFITVPFQMEKQHANIYKQMENDALLDFDINKITAVNAAILANKLLQIASGAVYDIAGNYKLLDTARYELVAELAQERPQSIVAFRWKHQKDLLSRFMPHAKVIDGSVPINERNRLIQDFQAGAIRTLLLHPKTAAHGLTLTAGYDTIWASPTYSSEEFTQFNHRIYRAGQTKKTRVILTSAIGTLETDVYNVLQGRINKSNLLLALFNTPYESEVPYD